MGCVACVVVNRSGDVTAFARTLDKTEIFRDIPELQNESLLLSNQKNQCFSVDTSVFCCFFVLRNQFLFVRNSHTDELEAMKSESVLVGRGEAITNILQWSAWLFFISHVKTKIRCCEMDLLIYITEVWA